MKKAAIVRFVGDQEYYRLSCENTSYKYCRDCENKNCNKSKSTSYKFVYGQLYNAYFLEYWQGERTSLHVKGSNNEIDDFNPIEDFEIVEDIDDVLNTHEATVRCITHKYDGDVFNMNYGEEYKSIGFNKSGLILVMDESWDCYFYPRKAFEVVKDEHGVLNEKISSHIYDWKNTHEDSVKT